MSDTSSPSVHVHPISPSSSFSESSGDSELYSEPTSDEEPDLGAFNTVLREWTHLQPPPRIPVQIRSATSSTTPTFQPSVTGNEAPSTRSRNRITGSEATSNLSSNRSESPSSALSSFTRPPSSSAHPDPEGSTVWAHAPIASYLNSGTPSNDDDEGESIRAQGEYTPNSIASTGLTVEIASETDFEESNGQTAPSPYPYPSDSGISLPLTLESTNDRLNSRENAHQGEEVDTPKGPFQASRPETSVQLLSQVGSTPTESLSTVAVVATHPSTVVSDSPPTFRPNRSRNPEPPRTTSDSSFTASESTSSSNLSLLSYQISETVSEPNSEGESSSNAYFSSNVVSTSMSLGLKTQKSIATSQSGSTNSFSTQRPQQSPQHSFPRIPITQASTSSSTLSPLLNPHSPLLTPEPEVPVPINDTRNPMLWGNTWRQDIIVNDLGTPDQPPSETLLFDPHSNIRPTFRPVVDDDDDDDDDIRVERHARGGESAPAAQSGNSSGYERTVPPSAFETAYTQHTGTMHMQDHHELYNEDEEEEEEEEEETFLPTPYAPRVVGPSFTPRGIPPMPVDSRSRPQPVTHTNISATVNSDSQPFGSSTELLLPVTKPETLQQRPSQNIPTAPLQYHFQINQSYANLYNNAQPMALESQPKDHQSSSNIYTPRALPSAPYVQPPDASAALSEYSTPQRHSPPDLTRNYAHGYPYSLLGLHALPTAIASRGTSTLPSASSIDSDSGTNTSRFPTFSDLSDDNSTIYGDAQGGHIETESIVLEQAVPSLGILDGVLSFIAVERERVRNNAVREGPASTATLETDDARDTGSGEEGDVVGHEGPGEAVREEEDWKHAIGNEADQPKRKRRRKRPTKAHASASVIQTPDVPEAADVQDAPTLHNGGPQIVVHTPTTLPATAPTSPKKKKKVKSPTSLISASASGSVISLSLSGEGPKTPTKARIRDKDFLIAPPLSKSASTSRKKDAPTVTILRRPDPPGSDGDDDDDDDDDFKFDGEKTPTNLDKLEGGRFFSTESSGSPINLFGKRGKRVGRREREREKETYDAIGFGLDERGEDMKAGDEGDGDMLGHEKDVNNGGGIDLRGDEDDQGEDNDSLSNLSLLKPPKRRRERSRRRKARDTTHIHDLAGITGAYQSTPGTPGHMKEHEDARVANLEQGLQENIEQNELFESIVNDVSGAPEKRKRTRSKRVKHTQSIPDLAVDAGTPDTWSSPAAHPQGEFTTSSSATKTTKTQKTRVKAPKLLAQEDILEMDRNQLQNYLIASGSGIVLMNTRPDKNQPPPDSKRGRLITLARQLWDLFPEQRDDLGRVISRLEKQGGQGGKAKVNKYGETEEVAETASKPVPIPGHKRKRTRKGHIRTESEGTVGGEGFDFDDEQPDDDNDIKEALEVEMEEEEIDPRGRPPRRDDALVHVFIDHSNILIGLLSHLRRTQSYRRNAASKVRSRPLPAIISKAGAASKTNSQTDPASSAFAAVRQTGSRPLPVPNKDTAIPLPSFATMARSFPTTSVLSDHMKSKSKESTSGEATAPLDRETNSDGHEVHNAGDDDSGGGDDPISSTKQKKYPRHLWHAALALILERGRPVTRRVVVTSSPLYQPMDEIERLGYELRVFIRVPDFGDGLDRERYRDKGLSSKSSGGAKSAQSSPVNIPSISGSPAATKKSRSIGHGRHLSENASTESGSGGASANTMGAGSLHSYYGTPNNTTPQAKVKFREQGVDELLQLKLHQALAAVDDRVPEGSTIVLATGDGNVGQFNEDGFLGPVRTALRRGWRVELYAWEDGLSRAWKREFGDGSEWGRSGLFRVIGMEQFAHGLVEALQ